MTAKRDFTLEPLEWAGWTNPVDLTQASDFQREVLKQAWPGADRNAFFLLLAREPAVLQKRMRLLNAIMYAPKGLSRAERELGATAESRHNECVYCASAHARLYAQLTKSTELIGRLLHQGVEAGFPAREQAVIDFSVALGQTPPCAGPGHVDALRNVGLSDDEIYDLIQAVAIFAWANRLMLSLGEAV